MLKKRIEAIVKKGTDAFSEVGDEAALFSLETEYTGRKSELSEILKGLKDLTPEEKKEVGPLANEARKSLEAAATEAKARIEAKALAEDDRLDVTLPGVAETVGHLHPITRLSHEIEDIFAGMGFSVADGPESETEFYNFDALNVPKNHPARDMQDTFWIKSGNREQGTGSKEQGAESGEAGRYLLRTHTSSVQVRYMETHTPPFRIIIPGRIFRNEATDASHEHTFHQFECLMVDVAGEVTVAHFKHVAETFFRAFFGREVDVRLRPSFFPFTEPSFEFDISCILCDAKGCPVCKQTGWLEIGGAGMVHQNVLVAAGYEEGKYQGFAWGFGLTRLAMMKYKIPDIRLFMGGDVRFIRQF
ncbi:MAG: phenylalanine--tRNA ligase subunit alpha [Candidatus Moranbacteria bacterium]|nr:phenylalanine--tRNA ligase subunit alpha [Candidatus Moranbacteria bacterium]